MTRRTPNRSEDADARYVRARDERYDPRYDAGYDSDESWDVDARGALARRRRVIRIGSIDVTPVRVALAAALLGSVLYVVFALLVVRDTSQIPMLSSGAAVLGIVFVALAVAGAQATWRAGQEGRNGQAFALAIGGGVAAMIGFGCFAAAVVLALVIQR